MNHPLDLATLRAEIDAVDADIVRLLARRYAAVRQIAAFKAKTGQPVVVPGRIAEVHDRVCSLAREEGLDPMIVGRLWRAIIGEAIALEWDVATPPGHDRLAVNSAEASTSRSR
jgi:isochorismate pyruvate lyase